MISEEYAAVFTQLDADTNLTVRDTVYDGQGELFRGQYAVLFGGAPDDLDDERATRAQTETSDAIYVFTVRCVSTTADGARSVTKHVLHQLVNFTPTVSGRTFDPMRLTHSDPVEPDTSVKQPLYYGDIEMTLVSRSA